MESPSEIIAGIKSELDGIKRAVEMRGLTVDDLLKSNDLLRFDWQYWSGRLDYWQGQI